MANRTRILVVDHDLDSLSRIYLALVHRNFKAEASDKAEEIAERMKRLKPAVLVLGEAEYKALKQELKIPAVVIVEKKDQSGIVAQEDLLLLEKPVPIEELIRTIERLVI